jgi:hypothetical protein
MIQQVKKLLFIFIIFNCLFLFNCIVNSTTQEFKQYLKTKLNQEPKNGDIYLFVPSNQCKNCIKLNATKLDIRLNNRLHIISSLPTKHFKNFTHYFFDKEDKLLELKFVDYENKFVFYNNNHVECVVKANIINPLIMPDYCDNDK